MWNCEWFNFKNKLWKLFENLFTLSPHKLQSRRMTEKKAFTKKNKNILGTPLCHLFGFPIENVDQENILRNFCLIYSPFSLGILSPQWNPNPKTKNIDDKCNDTQCSFILESEDKYNVSESQCESSHLWSAARELKILSSSCQLSRPHFLCSEINKFTLNCLPAYFSVVPNNILSNQHLVYFFWRGISELSWGRGENLTRIAFLKK